MKLKSLTWAAVAAALSMHTAVASAQSISEDRIQELIRAAASRAGVGAQGGATPQAGAPTLDPDSARPTLALTLDEAIKLALDRNLDIAVQRLNPQTFDFSLAGLRADLQADADLDVVAAVGEQPVAADPLRRRGRHGHRHHDDASGTAASPRTSCGAAARWP